LGQIPWSNIPAIPIELVLAPQWFPINLYSVSSWTRAMLVPMAIVQYFRATRNIPFERGVSQLFRKPQTKTVAFLAFCPLGRRRSLDRDELETKQLAINARIGGQRLL
jgi:squalene cyclase